MGLDIYLYHIPDRDDIAMKESLFSTERDKIEKTYGENPTPEQMKEFRKQIKKYAKSLGLDEDGESNNRTKIELPSKIYPDHYYKIGYFRSSYNDSGIERVLYNLGLGNLDWIFQNTEIGGYEFSPDWEVALERATDILEKFKKVPAYRCMEVSQNMFNAPTINGTEDAMALFLKSREEYLGGKKGFGSYTSRDGHFYMDEPLKVVGLIPGLGKNFLSKTPIPVINVIYESDNSSYIESLEIVIETCQWVLEQKDPENYYLHWSG